SPAQCRTLDFLESSGPGQIEHTGPPSGGGGPTSGSFRVGVLSGPLGKCPICPPLSTALVLQNPCSLARGEVTTANTFPTGTAPTRQSEIIHGKTFSPYPGSVGE
ncbi:hypothetical protein FOL46_003889, partial [Perkinsus olseni]